MYAVSHFKGLFFGHVNRYQFLYYVLVFVKSVPLHFKVFVDMSVCINFLFIYIFVNFKIFCASKFYDMQICTFLYLL